MDSSSSNSDSFGVALHERRSTRTSLRLPTSRERRRGTPHRADNRLPLGVRLGYGDGEAADNGVRMLHGIVVRRGLHPCGLLREYEEAVDGRGSAFEFSRASTSTRESENEVE